ncbi:MAG: conjugal transfer protein TraF [Arcobacteraceae bacterium]|jgi:hypothetical protein|nr:conjugal transfer protein TraF [Arcobacteraceae bacterium]
MKTKIVLSFITVATLSTLNGAEFKPVGFKAVGLGGAGVASTRGSLAGYYNPALLRFSDHTTELSINVGARLRESNLIDNVDTLHKVDIDGTLANIGNAQSSSASQSDIDNLKIAQNTLAKIGTNNALQLSIVPAISAQISDAFAVGIYVNADVGMNLHLDKNYLDIIVTKDANSNNQIDSGDLFAEFDSNTGSYTSTDIGNYNSSSLQYGIDNQKHYIQVDAMALVELPISYAKAYDTEIGTWSIGGNIKPMGLTTYSQKMDLGDSSDDAENGSDKGEFETKYKSTFGLDLGIAYRPTDSQVTFGLMGKNINSPKFKVDTTPSTNPQKDVTIDPLVRAGVSLPVWNDNVEFAFDADLTKNKTLVDGEESQLIGGGFEFHPASWFALRAGAMKDIASEKFDEGMIMSAGVGFGLKWLQFDLSAQMSSKKGEYDGQTIPRYAAVNLSLVSKWGDGYNRKEAPLTQEVAPETKKDEKIIEGEPLKTLSPEEQNRIKQESEKAMQELDKAL